MNDLNIQIDIVCRVIFDDPNEEIEIPKTIETSEQFSEWIHSFKN